MKKRLMFALAMVLVLILISPMATVFANGSTYKLYIKVAPAPPSMSGDDWLQPVGWVHAEVVGDDLTVRYWTKPGWEITETHLWVGEDPNAYPQTGNGNPKIGKFPWKGEYDPPLTDITYEIPLTSFPSYPPLDVTIMAQAVVRSTDGGPEETAWGDCQPLPSLPPRWAKSFDFTYTPPASG